MAEQKANLTDMLDHSPDIMADAKVKVMMSDIYDDMVSYVDDDNARKVAALISNYGTRVFIEWFIDNVYLPKAADVKVMAYVAEHKDDICDVLGQAMSNLTAKEVIDNAEEERQPEDGEEGGQDGRESEEGSGEEGGREERSQESGEAGPEKAESDDEEEEGEGSGEEKEPSGGYDEELLRATSFVDSLMADGAG